MKIKPSRLLLLNKENLKTFTGKKGWQDNRSLISLLSSLNARLFRVLRNKWQMTNA
jgi:ribosome-associated toxin RatA of RatAB toxin-antitoxin module